MKILRLLVPILLLLACARLPRQSVSSMKPLVFKGHLSVSGGRGQKPGRWWQALHDPLINRLVRMALDHNPSLAGAKAHLAAARALVRQHRAVRWPHVNARASMTREYFSRQGLHTTANGTHVLYTEMDPFIVRYHLTGFGRETKSIQAAVGDERAAAARQAAVRWVVTTAVVRDALAAMAADQELANWQQSERVAHSLLCIDQIRFRDGLSGQGAVYRDQERLSAVRQHWLAAEAASGRARDALSAIVGRTPSFAGHLAFVGLPTRRVLALPAVIPLDMIAQRPDVRASRWLVTAAAARVGAARAAFYPDINIALFAGWNSIDLGDLLSPANLAHAIGPVVTLPIFEGGALRAALSGREAEFAEAQSRYQATLLRAVQEVADGLWEWRRLRFAMPAEHRALVAARQARRLAARAFMSGLTNRGPLLRAVLNVQAAKRHEIRLHEARAETWVGIEEAMGGDNGGRGHGH